MKYVCYFSFCFVRISIGILCYVLDVYFEALPLSCTSVCRGFDLFFIGEMKFWLAVTKEATAQCILTDRFWKPPKDSGD